MALDSIFRIVRNLVPKRILDPSPAFENNASTHHSQLMQMSPRDVTLTGCREGCPGVLLNLFTLGLVCLAIGIGGCSSDKDHPPRKATNPFPAEDFLHSTITPDLQWENGGGADTYDIYLGTDEDVVANADSHDASFMGNQSQLSYSPSTQLFYDQDYYWRIDSINEDGKTRGDVWHFRTYNEDTVDAQHGQIHSIETIIRGARNPKWSPDGTKIAFMRLVGDTAGTGAYEIYLANPDGSGEIGISEICPDLTPGKHKGASSWHPSGQWLLLVVEKDEYLFNDRTDIRPLATLGIGLNTDMWLLAADGSQAWRLTNVPTKMEVTDTIPFTGILHPQFNNSGDQILYAFTENPGTDVFGDWEIRIADFTAPPDATAEHEMAQIYEPGDKNNWYETHSWSPDDSTVYISFSPNLQQDDLSTDIGTLDLSSGAYENLTDSWQVEGEPWDGNSAWDEHAFISKDGSKVIYISSSGFPMSLDDETLRKGWRNWLITELWWMGPNGEGQERISYFNDPTAPEFVGSSQKAVASGLSWNPETTAFTCVLGIRHQDPDTDETLAWDFDIKIVWLDLNQNGLRDADENQCGNGICEADETADSCPRDCLIDHISI